MRFLTILALGLLSFSCSEARQTTFEGCPVAGYENDDSVDCGYLEVPENRNDPDSRKIKLAYLVLKARNTDSQKDPIVYLQGGPGGATLSTASIWENSPFRGDHDFVLIDQRGTGYSNAVCADLGTDLMNVLAGDYNMQEEGEALAKAAAGCKAEMSKEGVDQAGYNTIQNAQDLEDLRKALGYEQWNLFGGSYGSRLALAYMRDFPGQTRTAILSGLFPPQVNLYENFISNFSRALELLFETCKNDRNCNKEYPNLRETYFEVLHSLEDKPYQFSWGGEPFVLNPQDMLMLTHQLLYSRFTYNEIPAFVEAIRNQEGEELQSAVQNLAVRAQLINIAMNWSFNAFDEMTFTEVGDLQKNLDKHPELKPGPAFFMSDPGILVNWHPHRAPSYVNEPVKSDIPTLLANGAFDPITPPANAKETLKYLENGYYAEFPMEGHSVFGSCYFSMVMEFLNNPSEQPDMSCATRPVKVNWD